MEADGLLLKEAVNCKNILCQISAMECRQHLDDIAKPLHSLGKLEDALIQLAGIKESVHVTLDKKVLLVMCADNGVVEEGVTQTGQDVTAIVANNFLKDKATASILCNMAGADIIPVDIGVASDTQIINKKISYGTKNMVKEPAMTYIQAVKAIETGIEMVRELKEKGYQIIATGEMGIGNTTTSSAVASVLLNQSPEIVTGTGAGLSSDGLKRKIKVIKQAIDLHQPKEEEVIEVLRTVGGYDIAGLTGVFLGGMLYRIPIVIDGFISSVAALAAVRLNSYCRDFILGSHISREPASKIVLEELNISHYLECNMCLGEGTGAVSIFPLLDMVLKVYQEMGTFDDNQIEKYVVQK